MSKAKKQSMPGKCVFCRETGLSKEHVFSKWLKSIIPKVPQHTQTTNFTLTDPICKTATIYRDMVTHQGAPNQRSIRKVCVQCNSGWMSVIVNQSKAIATRMINGEPVTLQNASQVHLAGWIALAVIMAEFLDVKTLQKIVK